MMKKTFVIYNNQTLQAVKEYTYQKAAQTAAWKMNQATTGAPYSVADKETFLSLPVPMMKVRSLMTGQMIEIPADTPWCCNPASETYWSM